MSMEAASPSGRTSPNGRAPEVVSTLIRLIAMARSDFREPLLDVLYQYRRREGVFTGVPLRPRRRGRPRKLAGRLRLDYSAIEGWSPAAKQPLIRVTPLPITNSVGPPTRVGAGGLASPTR